MVLGFQTQQKLNSIEMMARVVYGEARGETYEGKVAVAAVILNRMSTPGFPKNTYDVISRQMLLQLYMMANII